MIIYMKSKCLKQYKSLHIEEPTLKTECGNTLTKHNLRIYYQDTYTGVLGSWGLLRRAFRLWMSPIWKWNVTLQLSWVSELPLQLEDKSHNTTLFTVSFNLKLLWRGKNAAVNLHEGRVIGFERFRTRFIQNCVYLRKEIELICFMCNKRAFQCLYSVAILCFSWTFKILRRQFCVVCESMLCCLWF